VTFWGEASEIDPTPQIRNASTILVISSEITYPDSEREIDIDTINISIPQSVFGEKKEFAAHPKAKLAEVRVDFGLALPREGLGQVRVPIIAAAQKTFLGPQDLVNLAREILGNSAASEGFLERAKERSEVTAMEEPGSALAESPTSRFTAVNGEKQPTNATSLNGNAPSRRNSDERSNGQPRITPPGQEKLTITTTTSQREDWAPPANGDRQSYQVSASYSDAESSHKRKRSGSIEQNSSSANSYHSHALPSSTKETPTTATTESDGPKEEGLRGRSQSDSRDSYNPESQYRQFIASAEDGTPGADHWHARQYHGQGHINSDEHLGEVLQRASQSIDAQQRHDYDQTSPGDDDRSANPYSAQGYERREMSAQSDPKKRKRNFSNRTKTGCMTCRRRKKKCDETRRV